MAEKLETATLAAGCFWCVEAIFQRLEGVKSVLPGYSGGHIKNPAYREVCTGRTGHAEVAKIDFDPETISFKEILEVFWITHDPTTLNRQGNDVGTQYRSSIFFHNDEQKEIAEISKRSTEEAKLWPDPIVTEIVPFEVFYPAEEDHKNYFNEHPDQTYCSLVINPKVQKFKKAFSEK
ncbi:MAG: peptide-methionine (S)-S-oxide reductase MsrA [Flammeovirgaceae bacterium]|nr:peptide-methionine (S)-S-oxide reductase MsrA [Flammeovirgaceae bacterium]